MDNVKKFIGVSAAFVVFGLAPLAPLAVEAAAANHAQLAMMDEMQMKSDPSNSSMGQSGSQPMGGGGMKDDKMQMPGQTQDCQGPSCQRGSEMMQMMQMMERMMQGRMNSSAGTGATSSTATASGPADVTERLEGRIAFLKAELQITDKQLVDWNSLADALRSSRQHLLEARKLLVMDDKVSGTERIEHYERHLSERLEAIKSARAAFNRLYASLSEGQKQTADSLVLPLIATF